ncbi:hypothetical protein KL935_001223 [Ogataea polymorpha]|nr:hypothetical protein KL937_000637 [Ogataea polymorpha]KAG7891850.1 hypothetical protein KL936_001793 [Ogataea polymorpha]KAG7902315.1 hypothetical protein KL935_001223 [Ogataea polymorpha]KAG7911697.1 hypothetical protein KL906_001018 [Ogataea polymorpha]KAG7919083.1 hypothetical protein KL927_001212 [Ogataea polymorpha]
MASGHPQLHFITGPMAVHFLICGPGWQGKEQPWTQFGSGELQVWPQEWGSNSFSGGFSTLPHQQVYCLGSLKWVLLQEGHRQERSFAVDDPLLAQSRMQDRSKAL